MVIQKNQIEYVDVKKPEYDDDLRPIDLSDETMRERKEKIISAMKKHGYDALLIYADREHGANYGYLTGFEPRFEESVLVLHQDGKAYLLLGNESLRMNAYARLQTEAIHVPYFSLPNQPMHDCETMDKLLERAGIHENMLIGIVGWKLFTREKNLFDVPYFIMDALKEIVKDESQIRNATDLFISPEYGARITMNANEIAHFEFGAALASQSMLHMLDAIAVGKTEMELATKLNAYGQPTSVQTICASGERFTNAVVAPRWKSIEKGDAFASTIGYQGGLTNRSSYVVHDASELPSSVSDYLERVAKPYYAAASTWYSSIGIGVSGEEMYNEIEAIVPQKEFGWELNPGHFIASEEWLSSPFFPGSKVVLASGMMLQMDIIIKIKGYGGANAEDGIALADEALRSELESQYPQVWQRIQSRRTYMQEELGITLRPEVLPLSDSEGYFRPYLLNQQKALRVIKRS